MTGPSSSEPGNRVFPCGHDNPERNRFCDVCGTRLEGMCPLCQSPNRLDARFCGACGVRFDDPTPAGSPVPPAAAPAPAVEPVKKPAKLSSPEPAETDDWTDFDAVANLDRAAWERAQAAAREPPRSRWQPETDDEDDSWEPGHGRRKGRRVLLILLGVVGLVVAMIFVLVMAIGPHRRPPSIEPTAQRSTPTVPPPATSAPSPPAPPANAPSPPEASSPPFATASPGPPEPPTASPDRRPEPPASPPPAEAPELPPRTSLPVPPRTDEPVREAVPPPPRTLGSSAERVAGYLIDQLGKAQAERKARANAAWYGTGRPEYRYWEEVADAVARRPES